MFGIRYCCMHYLTWKWSLVTYILPSQVELSHSCFDRSSLFFVLLLIPNGCICFDATWAYLILFYWYGLSSIPPDKKAEGRSRIDREVDNHQLLQLEEKDVVSTVATALSDICGPGEWMPMEKLHAVVSFFQPFSLNSCLYKVTTWDPGLGSWIHPRD